MSSNLLRLEDCLEDSPQTRALLGVYERDSNQLLTFSQDINAACRRVAQAQNELALATQAFTQKLREFHASELTGSSDGELISSTVQQLASSIDEVSSYHAVLYSELSENMEYHSSKFLDKEMTEYLRLKASLQVSDKAHEEACAKLARVSKKNKSERGWQEATDQLYATRKAFHNTSMLYCCCLNDLQSKKKIGILRPIISYLQSQISFFKMGVELDKEELEELLRKLSSDLTQVEKTTADNRDLSVERMDRLDAESTRAYIPDPPSSMDFPDLPVDLAKTQISGYLFSRNRSGLLSQWHRNYFFTQGGNLMQQSKKEFAGQLFMDLDGCTVGHADFDDRRNVFQIISADGKHSSVLQGESKHQCEEWISTIRNISVGLYLEDNPRQAIIHARQSRSESSASTTSQPLESPQEPAKPAVAVAQTSHPVEKPRTSSVEGKPESSKPSMFERLKQAASSLMTPEEKSVKEPGPKELQPVPAPPQEKTPANRSSQQTQPDKEQPHVPLDSASGGGDSNLEMVLDANEPILFDLPSPVPDTQAKTESGDGTSENLLALNLEDSDDAQQPRQNPFTSSEGDDANYAFKAMFIVRFLGCKRVHPDSDLDGSIADTIWQVMAARALHKMFKMNELHLIISDRGIRLVDPTTQLNRETFPVAAVLRTKTHIDNPRLLGFIAHHSSSAELLCYTFESNADGDDVCCAINTARVMEQSKMEHEENKKQREIEMDLEEQSRMITASSTSLMKEEAREDTETPPVEETKKEPSEVTE